MIQTQTFAVDERTRMQLMLLSSLIEQHKNDPARIKELLAEHDAIMKRVPLAPL